MTNHHTLELGAELLLESWTFAPAESCIQMPPLLTLTSEPNAFFVPRLAWAGPGVTPRRQVWSLTTALATSQGRWGHNKVTYEILLKSDRSYLLRRGSNMNTCPVSSKYLNISASQLPAVGRSLGGWTAWYCHDHAANNPSYIFINTALRSCVRSFRK